MIYSLEAQHFRQSYLKNSDIIIQDIKNLYSVMIFQFADDHLKDICFDSVKMNYGANSYLGHMLFTSRARENPFRTSHHVIPCVYMCPIPNVEYNSSLYGKDLVLQMRGGVNSEIEIVLYKIKN